MIRFLKTLAIAAALAVGLVFAQAAELHKSGLIAEDALISYSILQGCKNDVVDLDQAKAKVTALWNKTKSEGYFPKGTDPKLADPKAADLDHRFDLIHSNAAKISIPTRDSDCHKFFDELMSK
jgi:hypothetical protein